MGHRGQLRDGTNTDPEANTAQGLPGQASFNSGAVNVLQQKNFVGGLVASPSHAAHPCGAHMVWESEKPRGRPASRTALGQAAESREPELSAGGVPPPPGSEAAGQHLQWQPNFANFISALQLEN